VCQLDIITLSPRCIVGALVVALVVARVRHGGVVVVGVLTLCEAGNELGHGHFDVELDHVCDGVELDVDDLVWKRHETNKHALAGVSTSSVSRERRDTHVHEDRDNHELGVEANERLILLQAMLFDESLLDSSKEVPVEASINEKDENLGHTIPNFIDANETALVSINLAKPAIVTHV
jgi:hypothetical protein